MTNKKLNPQKIKIMPNRVLVRLNDKDKEDIFFGRELTRDDGSTVRLITAIDTDPDMDRKSKLFRRTGDVLQVGRNVVGIQPGDKAILDYKIDNDDSIEIGHDGIGKLVAVFAVTEYVNKDITFEASRAIKKTTVVAKEGEIQQIADIMGVIRDGVIHAVDPYVFLKYDPFALKHSSSSIIFYEAPKEEVELEVIAVSELSAQKFNIIKGSKVHVKEKDTFRVDITDGIMEDVLLCCNDCDIKYTVVEMEGRTKEEIYSSIVNQ